MRSRSGEHLAPRIYSPLPRRAPLLDLTDTVGSSAVKARAHAGARVVACAVAVERVVEPHDVQLGKQEVTAERQHAAHVFELDEKRWDETGNPRPY